MAKRVQANMEYIFRCSGKFLYRYISNPSDLQEWFADDVRINKDMFTFKWGESESKARLTEKKLNSYVRFEWEEQPGEFTEMRLKEDQMTGDLAMEVIEYCDEGEEDDTKALWDSSIGELRNVIGA